MKSFFKKQDKAEYRGAGYLSELPELPPELEDLQQQAEQPVPSAESLQEGVAQPTQSEAGVFAPPETDATRAAVPSETDAARGAAPADAAAEGEADDAEGDVRIPTIAEEIRTLALKIMFVLIAFFVVFTFIFGMHRNLSVGMQPSLRDGDLLFYYRLDKNFRANNVVVFEYQDEMIASRVVAVPGDTVDITDDGLVINGSVMIEPEIYSETTQFKDGPTFPLTVEEDTVFVLGDNREHANDSRIIGLIDEKDVKGKVMGIIRRRNL